MIKIELVYAPLKEDLFLVELKIPRGTTVAEVLKQTQVLQRYPEIDFSKGYALGVYSKKVLFDQILEEGDRLEIYRPLQVDPKEARRLRARK